MSEQLFNSMVTIAMAIIGVAIVAVLVSRQANTANVLTSAGNAFARALGAATAPVTGSGMGIGAGLTNYYTPLG